MMNAVRSLSKSQRDQFRKLEETLSDPCSGKKRTKVIEPIILAMAITKRKMFIASTLAKGIATSVASSAVPAKIPLADKKSSLPSRLR